MINNDGLTPEQIEKFKNLSLKIRMDMFEWIKHDQDPRNPDLFYEICKVGADITALIEIYKEELKLESIYPISVHSEEFQNLNIVLDYIGEGIAGLLGKEITIDRQFVCNDN